MNGDIRYCDSDLDLDYELEEKYKRERGDDSSCDSREGDER